jgi:hypothetical protein
MKARRWNLLLGIALVLAVACGTEPEPRLRINGHVNSSVTGAGIPNARVELWFATFTQGPLLLQATTTDSAGAFALDIGPPPGYGWPNCATLHLEVSAAGFLPAPLVGVGTVDSPECRAGVVTKTITLTPAP